MIDILEDHFTTTGACLATLRQTCTAPVPDIDALCRARHGLISASMTRSRYIQTSVLPRLVAAMPALAALRDELDRDLSLLRSAMSAHIARWSIAAIRDDWRGYREASARFLARVDERLRRERRVLLPALRALA